MNGTVNKYDHWGKCAPGHAYNCHLLLDSTWIKMTLTTVHSWREIMLTSICIFHVYMPYAMILGVTSECYTYLVYQYANRPLRVF